jgi:hypothetical protein
MINDDKLRDAAESLDAVDHHKAKILMEAQRDFQFASDAAAVERAKRTLVVAIKDGPRYHPYMVPTPLTDEMIDDVFDDLLSPNAWKARMIEEVEAEYRAKSVISSDAYAKHGHSGLRKRLIFSSLSVLLMTVAILLHWRIGVIVVLVLFAFARCRNEFWSV